MLCDNFVGEKGQVQHAHLRIIQRRYHTCAVRSRDVSVLRTAHHMDGLFESAGLVAFLVGEKGFSEDRVRSAVKRINSAKGKATQVRHLNSLSCLIAISCNSALHVQRCQAHNGNANVARGIINVHFVHHLGYFVKQHVGSCHDA